jgi:hypothetical protein
MYGLKPGADPTYSQKGSQHFRVTEASATWVDLISLSQVFSVRIPLTRQEHRMLQGFMTIREL